MSHYKIEEPPEKQSRKEDDKIPTTQFQDIFKLSNLKIDKELPSLKFNQKNNIQKTRSDKIDISVSIPKVKSNIDLYLFINGIKRDMFHRINPNKFSFRNVKLEEGKNKIELFYKLGNRKSSSIYCSINSGEEKVKK